MVLLFLNDDEEYQSDEYEIEILDHEEEDEDEQIHVNSPEM